MDRKMMKRLLSLVLAAEMFCSPLAMARAADPAQARLETPLGEEVLERVPVSVGEGEDPAVDVPVVDEPMVDDPTVDAPDATVPEEGGDSEDGPELDDTNAPAVDEPVHDGDAPSYEPGSDQPDVEAPGQGSAMPGTDKQTLTDRAELMADASRTETYYQMAMSFGVPMNSTLSYPTCYNGYYKQETTSSVAWGYRVTTSNTQTKMPVRSGDNWYIALPNVGRLPDLELEGFYIMEQKPSVKWYNENRLREDPDEVVKWVYDEMWDSAIALTPTDKTPEEVGLTQNDDRDVRTGDYTAIAAISDADFQGAKTVYGYYAEEVGEVEDGEIVTVTYENYFIPVVARWQSSAHNELTALRVITGVEQNAATLSQTTLDTVYTENPRQVARPTELTLADINADTFADPAAPREFWIRVPEEQEALSLELAAFEPYYAHTVQGQGSAPVSVAVTFNGKTVVGVDGQDIGVIQGWLTETGGLTPGAVPEATQDGAGYAVPNNSVANPARSYWRVSGIPLGKVADAEDLDHDPFTTITLTVAAPNGEEAVYTIHVERLMTPEYTLGYGNTPVAMIERDTRGNWGTSAETIRANKDAARADFVSYRRLGNPGIVAPGDYVYYKGDYNNNAWRGLNWEGHSNYNIDLDETAIVAYQDMAFQDPGVTFTGSNGQKVEFGANADGAYKTCVTRTIQLRTADKLTVDLYGGGGAACWYTTDAADRAYLSASQASQVLQNADGSDVVDLRGLKVLPGVYTIVYTLTDPLTPTEPLVAKRPLVVLPVPGDVDMDGAVTLADALTLSANRLTWEGMTSSDVQLLRNRVWGAVSTADILGGFQPVLADRGKTDYYYPPLDTQNVYERKTWSEVQLEGSAKLELRYMGLEQGILQGEELHTTPVDGQMGPWMTNRTGLVTIREPNSYGHYQSDVFWVGVYLTAADLTGRSVEDLTLSLVYDSEYVTPAVVYQNIAPFTGDSSQEERWKSAIYYYNMGEGSKYNGAGQTLFSGLTGNDYSYKGASDWGRDYATHYSKVIGELESIQGVGSSSSLREMVICFQGGSGSSSRRVQLKDGCLLVMPFQLIKHPAASRLQDGQARLVELSAGMRDFNMVAKASAGSSRGVSVASLFGRMLTASAEMDGTAALADEAGMATYAFSAQDGIYGDATQNIRKDFGTVSSDTIPIGENKTATTVLTTGTYAEPYVDNQVPATGTISTGRLPKGLEYNSFLGRIAGTPEEAGTFSFAVTRAGTEYYYTLTIQKRTLRFNPRPAGSYYGQSEYRGKASANFEFVYKVEDLAERDRPAGASASGDRPGGELATILGADGVYNAPTFTARLSIDTLAEPVMENTGVGTYPILLEDQPFDDKYELEMSEELRLLTLIPRPVMVDYLTVDFDALRKEGYTGITRTTAQIYSDGDRLGQVIQLTELDPNREMIHLRLPQALGGIFEGRPLSGDARVTGDTLALRFAGTFQREKQDKDNYPNNQNMFYMTSGSERRPIAELQNLTLSNSNYQLVTADRVWTPEKNEIWGTVLRREITELQMAGYPNALTEKGQVIYGENIALNALRMKIFRDGQQIGDLPYDFTYDYDGVVAMAMDIHYNWVTKEEMEAGKKSPDTLVGSGWNPFADPDKGEVEDIRPYSQTNNGLLTCELDGYYLCAVARKFETSDPAGDLGEHGYVKCYSEFPVTVKKRELTLTLQNMNRFYGENSAEAKYTFPTAQLSIPELRKLQALYPGQRVEGDPEMLAAIMEGFQAPTIEFMKQPKPATGPNDPNLVTVDTDVTGTTYYIVMHGASATNYTFLYARSDGDRKLSDEFGTSLLNIWARPIVVEDIVSMISGDQENFAILYADSKELKLTEQVDGDTRTKFQADAALDQVVFTGPVYDPDTQSIHFYNEGDSNPKSQTDVVYTGDAVLAKDLSQLGVSYTVQFIPDQGHYSWNTFSQNYYSVEDLEAEGGQGQRPVELGGLKLTGAKARNYRLVYHDALHAMRQAPDQAELYQAPTPTQGMNAGITAYARYGTGLVILRSIKSMELASVGRMEYGYGEIFAPGEPNPVTNQRFVLKVQYDTRYENYPALYPGDMSHNISSESVEYGYEEGSDTFTHRGFTIHYIAAPNGPGAVTEAQKAAVAQAADPAQRQIIMGNDNLYYTVHNGKYLFVSGKRGTNDPMVYSVVSSIPLKVALGQITLMARDLHRFYGEENANGYVIQELFDPEDNVKPMSYTFYAGELARWDREKLGELVGKNFRETDLVTQEQLETALAKAATSDQQEDQAWAQLFGYVAPTITTSATKTSPVNMSHGKWGEYPMEMAVKDFANYKVTGQPGTLYVYPRPIRITGVSSSVDDPIYTIYNKAPGVLFNTSLSQDRVAVTRGNDIPGLTNWGQDLANSTKRAQLYLMGDAMVGEDELVYKAKVNYVLMENTTLPEGKTDATVEVIVTIEEADGLASSAEDAQRNYVLAGRFEDPRAIGAVKLRTIGYITISQLPKLNYTYGEALDLSGLKVRVVYKNLKDEGTILERVTVPYIDSDQFQSYGLYINYWDMGQDSLPGDLKTVPDSYRKAATGDHLTIAPTHDTQQYIGADGTDPLRRPFAANGMALIVSAFQDGLDQTPADPKVLAAQAASLEEEGVDSYEVTDANPYPAKIKVAPLQLSYTVSATDKTYNGDTKTAGTLRLTNVFDRVGVQVQMVSRPNSQGGTSHQVMTDNVTDVVYVPVGAAYEGKGSDHSVYPAAGYRVVNGAIDFTTGSYTYSSTSLLDQNDVVEWATGYAWDKGMLEFTFANPNVHYEDENFAGGLPGVGTAELAQYWRADQTLDREHDQYPSVSQMPVELHNMTLMGPDAANYTWAPSQEAQRYETDLTLDTIPSSLGTLQASLPYATIHKANRQSIQELLGQGYVLPRLMVDDHTNVVRMTYAEDLSKIKDMTAPAQGANEGVHNAAGVEDYRDELHFEYALAYQDEEGLLRQWAGKDGSKPYQDTLFFGGEVFLPAIDPGYSPDLGRLDKPENAGEKTVYKGQRYQWAEEDTGVAANGYREDLGFYIDPTAYPGYATHGESVRDAYWYYDLYNTDRAPLPRDTVFYPLVRLAETHNYNPSGDLTGDGDGDGTEDVPVQTLYETRLAVSAYEAGRDTEEAETLQTIAALHSKLALDGAVGMARAARKLAQELIEADAAIAENGLFPETPPETPAPISAVKTYLQRLDMLSASWERDAKSGSEEYLVTLVEAIEFTDTMSYPDQKLMDAVVYNNPTRYHGYSWDRDKSAQLRFGDEENPIDFSRSMTFAIQQRLPGGGVEETLWTYDPETSNHTAQLYVSFSAGGGQKVRSIQIVPSVLYARVGDAPIQLGVVTDPAMPINRRYTWSSSDPSVVTVSATGLVTFRGVGTATITVETTNGRSCSIQVTVSEMLGVANIPGSLFNFFYAEPWATLDDDYAFRPKEAMTRGDVVRLLDLFLDPDRQWGATQEIAYIDVTGKERYFGPLARLTNVGVVKGVPGSAFAGERLATRAEFVTMLARMLQLDTPDTVGMAHAFVDSGEDATWAYAYIDAMAKAGVIQGVGGGEFAPDRPITREESAAILARLLTVKLDTTQAGLITPSDMTPENWSYPSVLRAINTVLFPD